MRFPSNLLLIILILFSYSCKNKKKEQNLPTIGITQFATHPALDDVRRGIIKGLKDKGFEHEKNVIILERNANADQSLTQSIVEDFARKNAAVIVPISTPSTLGAAKATKKIPIVFSGVTDPIGTGLIKDINSPKGNITGLSDRWPFEKQIEIYLSFFPNHRKIGMIYKKGDDVSKIGVEEISKLSQKYNFELFLKPISSPNDIYPTAVAMLKDVDVIYTGIDHLILENMTALIKASIEAKKVIFGGESGSVEKGALMALTINMTEFGVSTSDLVAKVLNGVPIKDIPVATVSEGDLLINRKVAESINFNFEKADSLGASYFDK